MRIMGRLFCGSSLRAAACMAPLALRSPAQCGKHEEVEKFKQEAERTRQLKEAVEWCQLEKKRGWAGSHRKDDDGEWFWPLVSEGSINRRLNGKVELDHPYSSRSVLTPQEEADLVATCKELNSHGQGIKREQLGKMVLDSLILRPVLNEGREYAPLSHNAQQILKAGECGQAFFTRFFAEHKDLAEKRPAREEILRAKWMTPEVSASHFEKLKATLARAGLLDSEGKITDPRRVLNSDECPNPWRGTGDRGKIIAEVGKPCVKLVNCAREHTTLDVMISMDGHLFDPHLIFKGEYVQRQMIPDKSKLRAKVSATSKGYQTGTTLLETIQFWDKELKRRNVPKPVVWTTDGHSSRLNTDVLRWCRENGWIMYVSPPHTTGIHQALDQIFKTWHDTFNGVVERWAEDNTGKELNKKIFTDMFGEAWAKWTGPAQIVGACRRVGLSVKGVDPEAVPKAKFVIASTVAKPAPPALSPALPAPPATPALMGPQTRSGEGAPTPAPAPAASSSGIEFDGEWDSPSPPAGAYAPDSREYWMAKQKLTSAFARDLFEAGKTMRKRPLTLKETHPSWQVQKAAETTDADPARGRQRVKGAWGDMDTLEMLEQLDEQEREDEEKREAVAQRKQDALERKEQKQAAEAEAKQTREAALALERPVTDLLKLLGFVPMQSESPAAGELASFARANRAHLVGLGVDLTALTKKELMPQLTAKIPAASNVDWKKAPLKALPAPPEAAPAAAQLVVVEATIGGEPAAQAAPLEADDSTSEAASKRPRRGRGAAAQ